MALAQLYPLFALLLFALKLIDVVDVVVLLLTLLRLSDRCFGSRLDLGAVCDDRVEELICELVEEFLAAGLVCKDLLGVLVGERLDFSWQQMGLVRKCWLGVSPLE